MPSRGTPADKAALKRNQAKKLAYVRAQKAAPCMDCGGTFPPECMDFDHRPGEVKAFTLSRVNAVGIARIDAEIAKCDLVCANCHRIRTASRLRDLGQEPV